MSLTLVVMWSPRPALCEPHAGGWRSLQTCRAPEPTGILLRAQQTERSVLVSLQTSSRQLSVKHCSHLSGREGEVASGRGVTSPCAAVPGRGHLVL